VLTIARPLIEQNIQAKAIGRLIGAISGKSPAGSSSWPWKSWGTAG